MDSRSVRPAGAGEQGKATAEDSKRRRRAGGALAGGRRGFLHRAGRSQRSLLAHLVRLEVRGRAAE